jgi:uncharacterized protein YpuA (DUF1002 family)
VAEQDQFQWAEAQAAKAAVIPITRTGNGMPQVGRALTGVTTMTEARQSMAVPQAEQRVSVQPILLVSAVAQSGAVVAVAVAEELRPTIRNRLVVQAVLLRVGAPEVVEPVEQQAQTTVPLEMRA